MGDGGVDEAGGGDAPADSGDAVAALAAFAEGREADPAVPARLFLLHAFGEPPPVGPEGEAADAADPEGGLWTLALAAVGGDVAAADALAAEAAGRGDAPAATIEAASAPALFEAGAALRRLGAVLLARDAAVRAEGASVPAPVAREAPRWPYLPPEDLADDLTAEAGAFAEAV